MSLPRLALSTARSHVRLMMVMGAALLTLGLAQGLVILLVKGFIAAFFGGSGSSGGAVAVVDLVPEFLLRRWPEYGPIRIDSGRLAIALPLIVLLAGMAKSWSTYVYMRAQQEFSMFAGASLRDQLFPAILGKSYQELAGVSPGTWMSVLVNDVAFVQSRLSDVMTSFLRGGISISASLLTMFFLHWPSALVMMVLIPVTARSTGATGKRIAGFSSVVQESLSRMANLVLEVRGRFDFMRAQQGENFDLARFDAANDSYFKVIIRSLLVRSAFAPVLEFVGFAVFAGFIFAINRGWVAFSAEASGGSEVLLQFIVALGFMVKPLRDIGEQLARYHETRGAVGKCFDLLKSSSASSPQLGSLSFPDSVNAEKGLAIQDVAFTWVGSGKKFSAESINIEPGKNIAIVGPSGAGKSTFLKIVSGLLPPDRWISAERWQDIILKTSLVPQQPFLFAASVRENIAYGVSAISDENIWSTLDAIDARRFVEALPSGLDTPVSSLVANLSGGQIQRLVIARALLRAKPVLLLDEATSALDVVTEGAILRRLTDLAKRNRGSVVAVTHRLQWLQIFDEIWFIEDGRIALRGTQRELLAEPRFVDFCQSPESGLA